MNLACIVVGHRLPTIDESHTIGEESPCSRCGRQFVLVCQKEVDVAYDRAVGNYEYETGNLVVGWADRQYVEPGTEDERDEDER